MQYFFGKKYDQCATLIDYMDILEGKRDIQQSGKYILKLIDELKGL